MPRNRLIALLLSAVAGITAAVSWFSVRKLANRNRPTSKLPRAGGESTARKVAVVLNPTKAGTGAAAAAVLHVCAEAGIPAPLIFETTPEDAGRDAALRALEAGCDLVIAAGGDGTVRAVAESLVHGTASLGIIPLGTGNLLARNLEIPLDDPLAAAFDAVTGAVRLIDTGLIELEQTDGKRVEHTFLVIAGIGSDADIMDDTDEGLKAKVGGSHTRKPASGTSRASGRRSPSPWTAPRNRRVASARYSLPIAASCRAWTWCPTPGSMTGCSTWWCSARAAWPAGSGSC